MTRWAGFRRVLHLRPPHRGLEAEVEYELRHHIELLTEELRDEGWSEEEIGREVERRFGTPDGYRNQCRRIKRRGERRMKIWDAWDSTIRDLRFGFRGMRRRTGFSVTLVASLALGIGAVVSVFTVLDPVLMRPANYESPDELVRLEVTDPDGNNPGRYFSHLTALEVRQAAEFLPSILFHERGRFARTDLEFARSADVEGVTLGFPEILGVAPLIGRGFSPDDFQAGAPAVAILSYEHWIGVDGGREDIVGSEIRLDDQPVTVIGVMPKSFRFPYIVPPDLWAPIGPDGSMLGGPVSGYELLARLPEGMSLDGARERLRAVSPRIPRINRTEPRLATAAPFTDFRANSDVQASLKVLALAGGLLLLMSIVNGANLLLAQRSARTDELSLRYSLGASTRRVLRQLLTENLLVGLLAGVVAILIVTVTVPVLQGQLPREIIAFSMHTISVEWRVLLFTFGVTLLTGFAFGVLPAVLSRPGRTGLRPTSQRRSGVGHRRLRDALVVTQVAISVALLVAAGLLSSSFMRLISVDPGFDPERLTTLEVGLPERLYDSGEARFAFATAMIDRLEASPGVLGVTYGDGLPPSGGLRFRLQIQVDDGEAREDLSSEVLAWVSAEHNFFDFFGVPLLDGRSFREGETTDDQTIIIDEAFAGALWPGSNPVGRRMRLSENSEWLTVVGVVPDVKYVGFDDPLGRFDVYTPLDAPDATPDYLSFAVRTAGSVSNVEELLRSTLRTVAPNVPVGQIQTMDEAMWELVEKPRFLLLLVSVFTGIALTLAVVGIYGVMSLSVSEREREMGIRIALGASALNVQAGVLRYGIGVAVIGVIVGVVGALGGRELLRSLLFGIEPTDLRTIVGMSAVMIVAATLAAYLPARRATQVDPVEALRAE